MALLFISLMNPFDSNCPVGGAETSMKLIASGLAEMGHRVFFVTHRPSKQSRKKAKSLGVQLISFPLPFAMHRNLIRVTMFIFAIQLFTITVSRKITSVYCYYEVFSVASLKTVGKLLPKLFITMRIAGLSWRDFRRTSRWHEKIYKTVFQRLDQVNYIHADLKEATEKECLQAGISLRRARVFVGDIGTPVSELGNFREKKSLRHGHFTAIVPTRFSGAKRQDLIVEALKLLPADLDITIQFAGAGIRKSSVERMANDCLPKHRYKFLGFLSQQELWARIGAANLVILPTDYEGLSKVTLESMAIGTPVMASNVIPLNNYITSNKTGFLVENTPKAWADALNEVFRSPEKLTKVIEPAQQFVTEKYSSAKNLALYEQKIVQQKTGTNEGGSTTNPSGRISNPE